MPTEPIVSRCKSLLRGAWLLPLLCAGFLHANPDLKRFDEANLFFEQGRYQDAAAAYQSILDSGRTSPALHFNLGNTHFRLGQLGHAITHFRLAQNLAPRDPDITTNLRFARQQLAAGPSVRPTRLQRVLQRLHLDEWTLLTTIGLWSFFGLLTLRQFSPRLQPRLRPWTLSTAGVTALFALATLLAWHTVTTAAVAVALEPEVPVRFGPVEESPVRFTVPDGTELQAGDRLEDWVQVTDATHRTGWVRRSAVSLLP